jgi:uncharacterized protein (DUF488 family)
MRREIRVRDGTTAQRAPVEAKSAAVSRVFTLGHQGRDVKEVLQTVQRHGIEQVIDVRENASSKKPGFAAAELKQALAGIGVAYSHLPELGCTSVSRRALW